MFKSKEIEADAINILESLVVVKSKMIAVQISALSNPVSEDTIRCANMNEKAFNAMTYGVLGMLNAYTHLVAIANGSEDLDPVIHKGIPTNPHMTELTTKILSGIKEDLHKGENDS